MDLSRLALLAVATFALALRPGTAAVSSGQGVDAGRWQLVWRDEFNGPESDLDREWVAENGPSEHILSSRWRENAVVTNGVLRLVARKERRGGQDWTAASLRSRRDFWFGYFECRYRYAAAEGLNNSFWVMPAGKVSKGAKLFEIDVNEGHFPSKLNSNIHNHSDVTTVNGRRAHPTSPQTVEIGPRPDVTLLLEKPVSAKRFRFSTTQEGPIQLSEFRIYGYNRAGYPDALSPSADSDKPGLVNLARKSATKITTSGYFSTGGDTSEFLVDGHVDTCWISQREGEKWVEFAFSKPHEVGCVQFLNGWGRAGEWHGLLDNYRVDFFDGIKRFRIADFSVLEGPQNLSRAFHTYALEWNERELVFYFDGREMRRERNDFCKSPASVWLSLAVMPWAGRVTDAIDGTAMEVDYVRVFRRKE